MTGTCTDITKRKQVEAALSMDRHAQKSDREIARLCDVSHTFVAVVRNPDMKKQRDKNRESSFFRKAVEPGSTPNSSWTTNGGQIGLNPETDGFLNAIGDEPCHNEAVETHR